MLPRSGSKQCLPAQKYLMPRGISTTFEKRHFLQRVPYKARWPNPSRARVYSLTGPINFLFRYAIQTGTRNGDVQLLILKQCKKTTIRN
ncbi:hypothetical protein SAMN04487894_101321 [Niabella drilacis]|uniref:Uncharacterized protein n=1 Tax=Niabella drilacis (strain DSM 25811 / CCM 8410 / CCUG 62505 / LMG 26954 / E90) TaxID=1285928 RepID=A0A1G6IT71_NIADE|nr:hypothetical protein SAMN04487894_101321 [Niabella drilacis]